jgi:TPP-dependent pyruvate/acetoin dehydrogenase alpha subunit
MINNQSAFHSALNLCKNDSLAVLFGRNNNSYTVSVYTHIHFTTDACLAKGITKNYDSSECCAPRKSSCMPFLAHVP